MKNLFLERFELTDLEIANKLLEENLKGFLKLFNSSPACISLTTLERVYVKVNQKFLEKFGYSEDEIIGKNSIELGILDTAESLKVGMIFQENGKLENDIVKCIAKDGTEVYTVSSIEMIEFNGENYLLSSFLDITKIIKQEQVIECQNKEILDSINYACLIQNSILPNEKQMEDVLPESFVLAKPKNILSGDFLWVKKKKEKIFVSACDCTGHGVPGALISIIGFQLLNKFIDEYHFSKPSDILNQLNKEFTDKNTQFSDAIDEIKDGMDISLGIIDLSEMTIEYAGAYNPIYLVRRGILIKLQVDKIPINLFTNDSGIEFQNNKMKIEHGDCFYLFSDGYADQFGGPNGKKFRYKNFQELILSIHHLPMSEQREIFDNTIEEWKNASGHEQTDDILIVGFKIE